MLIRPETEADFQDITNVTVEAFQTVQISNQTEQYIIEALRQDNALTISLVAEIENRIVGHVALSPITISDGSTGWYALGPVSVKPSVKKQGIGTALIENGLLMLKELKGNGCVLVGDPLCHNRVGRWQR